MNTPERTADIQKKVCMLGAFAVGKTSLVRRFVHSIFDERYQTTVGVKIDKKVMELDSQSLTVVLWDFAGHDQFADIRPTHLRGASGGIFVIDRTRPDTLQTAATLHRQFQEVTEGVPVVVVLNKSDLTDDADLDLAAVANIFDSGATILETSAKNGNGVEDAFLALARQMLRSGHDHRSERD